MLSICLLLTVSMLIGEAAASVNLADGVECGRPMMRQARIKGGNSAKVGEFPWLVSVRVNGGHFCGGSLINNRFVLTAAHCTQRRNVKHVTVVVGEYHLLEKETNPEPEKIINVKSIFNHENFTKRYIDDISILELSTPVKWSRSARPLCLPDAQVDSSDTHLDEKSVTVAGWGWTDEQSNGGIRANIMQKATVTVIPRSTCQDWYLQETGVPLSEPQAIKLYETHLCAGVENGKKDACRGDSGGPLMIKDREGRQVNIGIVSAGVGCGRERLPGLYTRVSKYTNWIRDTIRGAQLRA